MTGDVIQNLIFGLAGGLGIFLLGMKNMSEGMQAIAGERLRHLINAVTDNRFMACAVGVIVTCLIQSSSVTTVMVVGFVNAGFMTLMQAISVIIGANIGTTVTGWILVLKIGKYGLPILGLSAFIYLFAKNERVRYTAMMVMGIGMVFFGLELMKNGLKPVKDIPAFQAWFQAFGAHTHWSVLFGLMIGCIATAIVQSSSATLGIVMALAATEQLTFQQSGALIMGLNIGTTITAFLASLGAATTAKRAAYAHIVFNILGSIWIFVFFFQYLEIIEWVVDLASRTIGTGTGLLSKIAAFHTLFNVINTVIFLPLVRPLAWLVSRMVPGQTLKETPQLTFLDVRMLDTPSIGIQQSKDEIVRMSDGTEKMLAWLKVCVEDPKHDRDIEAELFRREEIFDNVQKEITEFLSHMLSGTVPHHIMAEGRKHLRMSDEYESMSDYIVAILKLNLKLKNQNLSLSEEGLSELRDLHDRISKYVDMINQAVARDDAHILSDASIQGETITHVVKQYRENHLARIESGKTSPLKGLVFADILSSYRKIKDHAMNIAEALCGEK